MSAQKAPQGKHPDQRQTALFEENVRLKQTIEDMKRTGSVATMDDLHTGNRQQRWWWKLKNCKVRPMTVLVLMVLILIAFLVYLMVGNYNMSSSSVSALASQNAASSARIASANMASSTQACKGNSKTKTFPDIDFALFGYNIFYGYPLAIGHDPGLTRPIFKSDYTDKKLTADCRYFLPKGMIIVPDISCVTSFTSTTIQDQYQLSRSLSSSAKVSGGGWGVKFSASAQYKKKSSEVGSKESVYINSEAKCDYYLSMIDDLQPPALSKSFLMMARTIKTESDVFKLFDYYGTHYLKEVTFGARFVYENKMSKSSYETLSKGSMSITAKASASSFIKVEGEASLSKKEKAAANEFRELVETSTISVGAPPPPNGSTNLWASEVKENPVPTKYKMAEIEELFTKSFMEHSGLDFEMVGKLINSAKGKYCKHLKNKGIVDSCKTIESYTKFKDLKLGSTQFNTINADQRSCIKSCVQEKKCIAAVNRDDNKCDLFQDGEHSLLKATNSVLVLFIDRLNVNEGKLTINNAELAGQARAAHDKYNVTACEEKCREDRNCIVFTSTTTGTGCKLYQQLAITEDSIKFNNKYFLQFNTNKTLS